MSNNQSLSKANQAKNDEFYTKLADIENELRHYQNHRIPNYSKRQRQDYYNKESL